ncbi:MAG: phenylacetic acid degradation-related protein [Labilithrix sp.]|nr:phenylacetic acid degradation-related protein [Labilithrix sp.]
MPTLDELRAFLAAEFPQASLELVSAAGGVAVGRLSVELGHLRPGGTVSGPAMMTLADAVTYMALLSRIGIVPLAVTTSLSISFLKKPRADRAVRAEATMLDVGPLLAFADVKIVSEAEDGGAGDLVAHASVTYAIPPPRP